MYVIVAYFSPETLLPATSIIATALGFLMLLGRSSYRIACRAWRLAATRSFRIAATSRPHYDHSIESDSQPVHSPAVTHSASIAD